jgi:aminoglycoside phosphotransferase (APT) family kinase protein
LFALDVCAADPESTLGRHAAVIAAVRPATAAHLARLTADAEDALASLPRGFGHGDFWAGNLLQVDGRLSAVVDWEAAGPGRLPLIDLLHLLVTAERVLSPEEWGSTLVAKLVHGDAITRGEIGRYLGGLGLELSDRQLAALVVAYWLDHTAGQLSLYETIAQNETWLRRNVDDVLQALRD